MLIIDNHTVVILVCVFSLSNCILNQTQLVQKEFNETIIGLRQINSSKNANDKQLLNKTVNHVTNSTAEKYQSNKTHSIASELDRENDNSTTKTIHLTTREDSGWYSNHSIEQLSTTRAKRSTTTAKFRLNFNFNNNNNKLIKNRNHIPSTTTLSAKSSTNYHFHHHHHHQFILNQATLINDLNNAEITYTSPINRLTTDNSNDEFDALSLNSLKPNLSNTLTPSLDYHYLNNFYTKSSYGFHSPTYLHTTKRRTNLSRYENTATSLLPLLLFDRHQLAQEELSLASSSVTTTANLSTISPLFDNTYSSFNLHTSKSPNFRHSTKQSHFNNKLPIKFNEFTNSNNNNDDESNKDNLNKLMLITPTSTPKTTVLIEDDDKLFTNVILIRPSNFQNDNYDKYQHSKYLPFNDKNTSINTSINNSSSNNNGLLSPGMLYSFLLKLTGNKMYINL